MAETSIGGSNPIQDKLVVESGAQEVSNETGEQDQDAGESSRNPLGQAEETQLTNKQRRHAKRDTKSELSSGNDKPKKQRRELDVYNRILWDERYDPSDIVIGYLDRHSEKGILEIDFEAWDRESTAEEFIPLHRIKYFRRRNETTFLWHRSLGIDEVFGSL